MALHFMSYTYDYYFYTMLVLVIYFSIFLLLVFFGHKKEMRLLEEELDNFAKKIRKSVWPEVEDIIGPELIKKVSEYIY